MIVTWRIALRIALIVVVTIVLQISFFSYLTLFGTTPNVVPLMVVSLGLLGGGMVGAVCGFAAGLLLDSKTNASLMLLSETGNVEILSLKLVLGSLSVNNPRYIPTSIRTGRTLEAWQVTTYRRGL